MINGKDIELTSSLMFLKMPNDQKMELFEKILCGIEYYRVGDFIVSELPDCYKEKREEGLKSLVIHYKSGQWRCFTLSCRKAMQLLKEKPEKKEELLQCLFDV